MTKKEIFLKIIEEFKPEGYEHLMEVLPNYMLFLFNEGLCISVHLTDCWNELNDIEKFDECYVDIEHVRGVENNLGYVMSPDLGKARIALPSGRIVENTFGKDRPISRIRDILIPQSVRYINGVF
jgi:hypothetical protein